MSEVFTHIPTGIQVTYSFHIGKDLYRLDIQRIYTFLSQNVDNFVNEFNDIDQYMYQLGKSNNYTKFVSVQRSNEYYKNLDICLYKCLKYYIVINNSDDTEVITMNILKYMKLFYRLKVLYDGLDTFGLENYDCIFLHFNQIPVETIKDCIKYQYKFLMYVYTCILDKFRNT